jgi:hypothetical protein
MSNERFQKYVTFVLAGFSLISAAAGLSQLKPIWLYTTLILSAFLAAGSAFFFFFFRAHANAAFGELFKIIPPVYWTKKVETKEELRAIAALDEQIYGSDSIDYRGLLDWWNRYKGVTLVLKDSEIIGGVGIWPLSKECFDGLAAGDMDETQIGAASIHDGADPAPRPYWYFGDIILLKKYRRSLKNLSLILLQEATRDWIENGNLADEVHVCALAFKEKGERRTGPKGEGEKLLLKFKFEYRGKSPAGFPVYTRTLTREKLVEDFEARIVRPMADTEERAQRKALAPAPAARRWQWVPAAVAVSALLAVIAVRQLPAFNNKDPGPHIHNDVPERLAEQTAEVLKIGVRDHTHCAIALWDEKPVSDAQMAKELGGKYAGLIREFRENFADAGEVVAAHHCEADGRSFVHLILKRPNALLSVIITEKDGESFPQDSMAAVMIVAGVPVYSGNMKTFEVAGFETQDYLIFVVSNLNRENNLQVASKLAPRVRRFLDKLET